MKKLTEVELITCDTCGKTEVIGDAGDEANDKVPEGWFHGTVMDGNDIDERNAEWSACKITHIKSSILDVLDLG